MYLPLEQFLSKVPKAPPAKAILELEFKVAEILGFDFAIHHPYWPLYGYFLDMQSYLQNVFTSKDQLVAQLQQLAATFAKAKDYVSILLLSDAPFLYWSSQIALGCFRRAAISTQNDQDFYNNVQQYLRTRLEKECERVAAHEEKDGEQVLQDLFVKLQEIEELIAEHEGNPPNKLTAQELDKKLQSCRNPEQDPTSHL